MLLQAASFSVCRARCLRAARHKPKLCGRAAVGPFKHVARVSASAQSGAPHQDSGDAGASVNSQASLPSSLDEQPQLESLEDLQKRLKSAERELQEERERATFLQAFRVSAPKRGVIGSSKYAKELRRAIVDASRDKLRRPVLVFGEPGLEKDNLAALIHFGSSDHAAPMVRLDCDRLDEDASDLYGAGKKKGLLYYLPPDGTLLLNNVHKAPQAVLPRLRQTVKQATEAASSGAAFPRVILVAESACPQLADLCRVIKVPPLRVRRSDVRAFQTYYLHRLSRQRDVPSLRLTDDAVRQLESYTFPLNIVELRTMVERAATQASTDDSVLTEELFWFAKQPMEQLRYNLLKIPQLRRFVRSSLWPEDINHKFTVYAFAFLVALLFVGPQDRAHNFGLNAFWCYWWPLSFIAYPFLGRVWCAVCPFMIYGEIVQRWRLSRGAKLLKWPRERMDRWGAWFLLGLFAVILVWEEVWELPDTAYLSSWLLLIITAGAMIGSWFFERRIWCRYLCPVGGMNGLFAKLSMTELRARQGVCSSTCTTYHCFKGGPAEPPEGLETGGCPVYSHPAQLVDNRNCVLCFECLKACPHRSIEFRLRLPGVDLWTSHKALASEVCLMFMLLGAVYLHDCDDVLLQLSLDPSILDAKLPHILVSSAFLALPGLLAWGVDSVWRLFVRQPTVQPMQLLAGLSSTGGGTAALGSGSGDGQATSQYVTEKQSWSKRRPLRPFVELAYGYLPLVWGGTLAYYLDSALEEAGLILPVAAATFGIDAPWLPTFTVDPIVTEFLQGATLWFSCGLSLILTRKLGARPWVQLAPQLLLTVLFTAELYALIIPN